MAGMRSRAAASNLRASAWPWRSACSCSLSVSISSLVRSGVRSWGRSGSGVGSVFNRTYNRPPSRVLGSVPRFTRILTAPLLIPRASAASVTGTRRWFGVGSTPQRYVLHSFPTRRSSDLGDLAPVQASVHGLCRRRVQREETLRQVPCLLFRHGLEGALEQTLPAPLLRG